MNNKLSDVEKGLCLLVVIAGIIVIGIVALIIVLIA